MCPKMLWYKGSWILTSIYRNSFSKLGGSEFGSGRILRASDMIIVPWNYMSDGKISCRQDIAAVAQEFFSARQCWKNGCGCRQKWMLFLENPLIKWLNHSDKNSSGNVFQSSRFNEGKVLNQLFAWIEKTQNFALPWLSQVKKTWQMHKTWENTFYAL